MAEWPTRLPIMESPSPSRVSKSADSFRRGGSYPVLDGEFLWCHGTWCLLGRRKSSYSIHINRGESSQLVTLYPFAFSVLWNHSINPSQLRVGDIYIPTSCNILCSKKFVSQVDVFKPNLTMLANHNKESIIMSHQY